VSTADSAPGLGAADVDPVRVLLWCDYCATTGFATVGRNLVVELGRTGRYVFDVMAINYTAALHDPQRWPGRVIPAVDAANWSEGDPFGRRRFVAVVADGNYDVVLIVQDTFVVEPIVEALRAAASSSRGAARTVLEGPG
jgi:hypothetical protein